MIRDPIYRLTIYRTPIYSTGMIEERLDEERPRRTLAAVLWITAIVGGLVVLLVIAAHANAAGGCGGG